MQQRALAVSVALPSDYATALGVVLCLPTTIPSKRFAKYAPIWCAGKTATTAEYAVSDEGKKISNLKKNYIYINSDATTKLAFPALDAIRKSAAAKSATTVIRASGQHERHATKKLTGTGFFSLHGWAERKNLLLIMKKHDKFLEG